MKPLTLDCARVRQQLDALHDGELDAEQRAFVERHLETCTECLGSWTGMQRAITALRALPADDLAALRAPLDAELGIDERPLSRLLLVAVLVGLVALALGAFFTLRATPPASPAPSAPLASLSEPAGPPLPTVGVELGVEVEPEVEEPFEEPLPVKADPEPPPAPEVEPPPPPPIAIAKKPAPPPEPKRAAPKPAPNKPKPRIKQLAKPLPGKAKQQLERLQLAKGGLSYKDLVVYFVRDPDDNDRFGRRVAVSLPRSSEASPRNPERIVIRPRRSSRYDYMLQGELIDGPLGLRILRHTRQVSSGRTTLTVVPIGWDALRRRNAAPILKGPVLVPTYARRALLAKQQPGPVALFLQALTEPTMTELKRLAVDLARIEFEAKELERRLRARVGSTRGLVGLGLVIRGTPRVVEVFSSPRVFSAAFPKLLRSALLEARLRRPLPKDDTGADFRPNRILSGATEGRKPLKLYLTELKDARLAKLPKVVGRRRSITSYYRAGDVNKVGAGGVYLDGVQVAHAVFFAKGP